MESKEEAKKELSALIKSYSMVSSIVVELRDEGTLNPHDCDNILGHLKSGLIEDVLMYTRSYLTQDNEKNALKTMSDYLIVKKSLEGKNLKPEDIKDILSIFFKK
ncbi:MAG: hypothetical protein V1875_01865 [Candidatus Altiarchaeota archaeon]